MTESLKNVVLTGADSRPVLLSGHLALPARGTIVFAHGFKGFKDWGHWHHLGRTFARSGYTWLAFNFSHNGTSPEEPEDFVDLEAFGQNNYSKELFDLRQVLQWLEGRPDAIPGEALALDNLWLIGHSRGGPIALITAARDARVRGLITWASVSSLAYAWPDDAFLDQWRQNGKYTVINGRTGQEMPLYYQLYEDYRQNRDILDVEAAAGQLGKPYLIQHGTSDPAVPPSAARALRRWAAPWSRLHLIEGADHVFGGHHPWRDDRLPPHSEQLVEKALEFLEEKGVGQ